MAKNEYSLHGSCSELVARITDGILAGSSSASLEDGSDFDCGNVHCAVRVFERYSIAGSNRVSLSVTVLENDNDLSVSAITSGGSQAMFFKLNTFGEETFLACLEEIIADYGRR